MELFGNLIFGDFNLEEHDFILVTFSNDMSYDENSGLTEKIDEEYIGANPIPLYIGSSNTDKLALTCTIIHTDGRPIKDSEMEYVLRELTGLPYYEWMQIYDRDTKKSIYYRCKVVNVKYQFINGYVAGIILFFECDSPFAWSQEYTNTFSVAANETFDFYNMSGDKYHYLRPSAATITVKAAGTECKITNITDDNYEIKFNTLYENEIITMDCENEIIDSSIPGHNILDDFNLHWFRFLFGKNDMRCNFNADFTFKYRLPMRRSVIC